MSRVVAVDGPAAAGKSTTARRLAERLGFRHVNSGLLYRTIAWVVLRRGWDESDPEFGDLVRGLRIRLVARNTESGVRVEGEEPGADLTSREVSARVSAVSAHAAVREKVLEILRAAAEEEDLVCEGRDIGTVVFPDASLKIFLTASAEERARRRLLDYGQEPTAERVAEEAARLRARDVADSSRALAPLRRAADAVEVDTTLLSPEEAVEQILELARARDLEG